MSKRAQPVALVILDGWGLGNTCQWNAICNAKTPHMSALVQQYPSTVLDCSGEAVGLPEGQMGNSEVGHLNIGAGRVVYQELTRISRAIRTGEFFTNDVFTTLLNKVRQNGGALHVMGLLSDGGVHSHIEHLYALLKLAKQVGISRVYVHAFLDGRDVPPSSAGTYIEALEQKMAEIGVGTIATIAGRYYAMDRDNRWERVEKAYAAMVYGEGEQAVSARAALDASYARHETDEFVLPTVIQQGAAVHNDDGLIFFNFRPDRAREISRAFIDTDFKGFARRNGALAVNFACMTQYDETMSVPVAYKPSYLTKTLGEVISAQELKQLRIAETEKYAHVTFFFNGGAEKPFPGEERCLVPSPKVATYDQMPQMSAYEVTDAVVERIQSRTFDLIVLNYANGDMVGHTGVLDAAIKAIGTVDECVGRVVSAMQAVGGIVCISADHGNAEQMLDPVSGEPYTAHTTNKVPFILVSQDHKGTILREGVLADIAPTILELMNIVKPVEMTGQSLIVK
jgi:2,3-bisphosphoglycerate-independent phosphoglycerate mutase